MERSRLAVIGAPLAMLLVGGGVGWLMRDDGSSSSDGGTAGNGTVVGHPIPSGAELETAAPVRPLPAAHNTMIVDTTRILGYPEDASVPVPHGAALPLALSADGSIVAVDAVSLSPATVTGPPTLPPVEAVPLTELAAPGTPPSTLPPPDDAVPTLPPPAQPPGFVDPCITAAGCAGASGQVLAAADPVAVALDPLQVSMPFAATGAIAQMCNTIEAGNVPDPFLAPASRPTVAVVVNQPSTIALTGTWGDGAPLDKLTMVTSAEFDDQWRQQWDQGTQGSLVACLTLPLDVVRTHASAGRATLDASLLAISADGRVELGGGVPLTVPIDGEDPPFVDQVNITSLGEQRAADGTLVPTVHVHYAVTSDTIIPAAGKLNQRTAKVYASNAFVENADCAGWAVNQQGLDRSAGGRFTVAFEQRTVAGRNRPVTVVDGDMTLDPAQPGGWNGFACVHLFVADDSGNRVTVALRGAAVRSPRTAVYTVGLQLADAAFPPDWTMSAVWARPGGAEWCGPAKLTNAAPAAACTTYARFAPDGITLIVRGIDAAGAERPAFVVNVPINTAYCNPDDPNAWASDGCNSGFAQTVKVPLDDTGTESATMNLSVSRTADAGTRLDNPSQSWQIDIPQAFSF
jgi:hypothetical protein